MECQCKFDPKSLATTIEEICADVAKESEEKSQLPKFSTWIKDYLGVTEGAMAGRMMISDQKLAGTYAIAVTDEKKARAFLADMPEKIKLIGISELYKSMGMKCDASYKPAIREHAGVKIDE